jgi:threonine/homoserine/homoserine lactone efflux protein
VCCQGNLGWAVSFIASLLNVSQIMLFNLIYQGIAVKLTDQENHRTDTEYENALILKVFVSQFINSYASLFFLAFVAAQLPRPHYLSNVGE